MDVKSAELQGLRNQLLPLYNRLCSELPDLQARCDYCHAAMIPQSSTLVAQSGDSQNLGSGLWACLRRLQKLQSRERIGCYIWWQRLNKYSLSACRAALAGDLHLDGQSAAMSERGCGTEDNPNAPTSRSAPQESQQQVSRQMQAGQTTEQEEEQGGRNDSATVAHKGPAALPKEDTGSPRTFHSEPSKDVAVDSPQRPEVASEAAKQSGPSLNGSTDKGNGTHFSAPSYAQPQQESLAEDSASQEQTKHSSLAPPSAFADVDILGNTAPILGHSNPREGGFERGDLHARPAQPNYHSAAQHAPEHPAPASSGRTSQPSVLSSHISLPQGPEGSQIHLRRSHAHVAEPTCSHRSAAAMAELHSLQPQQRDEELRSVHGRSNGRGSPKAPHPHSTSSSGAAWGSGDGAEGPQANSDSDSQSARNHAGASMPPEKELHQQQGGPKQSHFRPVAQRRREAPVHAPPVAERHRAAPSQVPPGRQAAASKGTPKVARRPHTKSRLGAGYDSSTPHRLSRSHDIRFANVHQITPSYLCVLVFDALCYMCVDALMYHSGHLVSPMSLMLLPRVS